MLRTLLPLSLLIAGMPAQVGVPVPAPGPAVIDLSQSVQGPPSAEMLANATWPVPGPVAEPKWTLWAFAAAAELRDLRGALEDLQRRFGERRVRIAMAAAPEDAKAIAGAQPPFAVASLAEADGLRGSCWLQVRDRKPVPATVDGAVDLLQTVVDGRGFAPVVLGSQRLEALLANLADGGDYRQQAADLVALLPHSGRARATPVLVEWWCTGDLGAARRQFDAGLQALATEPWALAVFADLVLRGDRSDPSFARELALAMTPVAAAAPDSPFVQLVQLRALLRAGQDKLAGRMVSTVGKLCRGSARDLVLYAETLMEANDGAPWRALAERALDEAAAAGADARWVAAARYKALVRGGAPAEAAKLLADFRTAAGITGGSLNNDAWYMMIRPETMGRFDDYALGQCEEMLRQEGDAMSYSTQDTVALALFLCGRLQEAIDLEAKAIARAQNRPHYAERLLRYRNTLAAQQARKDGK
jgi:hypothetical protein